MPACIHAKDAKQGIRYGEGYNSRGIGERGHAKIVEVVERYRPWVETYRGGNPELSVGSGIMHESRGDPTSTSDPHIGESGLMSVTTGLSRKWDVDPFDPEANIWAGNRLKNERVRRILDDPEFSWLADAEPFDWTKLAWKLPGSLGFGGWKVIMRRVFPRPPTGEARRKPYEHMVDAVRRAPGKVPTIGRMNPGIVACRIVRQSGTMYLEEHGSLVTPDQVEVIARPDHLPRFDEAKYARVWGTPKRRRHDRFPEYLRVPEKPLTTGTSAVSDAVDVMPDL